MKQIISLIVVVLLAGALLPSIPTAHASDQINYVSQPEAVMIFLNDVAFAHDTITLTGGAAVNIVLPEQVFQDTLILRENGQRVSNYRISRSSGQVVLGLTTSAGADVRELTLDYLFAGLGWKPTYDMWLLDEARVQLDFLVEIQNRALRLDDVEVRLVAGRVDTGQVDTVSTVTANQYIAGYEETGVQPAVSVGPVTIQHVYPAGRLDAAVGDTVYLNLLEHEFAARRLLLWNAQTDLQAQVIYKVINDAELPLAEGIVRSYEDDLFIGSDFIEVTPIGSEGSVTVGGVQDLRVNRAETQVYLENAPTRFDIQHEVTLTLNSFSEGPLVVDVVDRRPTEAQDFVYSMEPQQAPDNLLRWQVTVSPGETLTIEYEFKTD